MTNYQVLIAFALACFIGSTVAIKCHVCEKRVDGGEADCGDPYSGSHVQDCGDSVTMCAKGYSKGSFLGMEFETTTRACGIACAKLGKTDVDILGIKATSWCCEGDSCNSAAALAPALVLALTAAFAALFA